MCEKTTRSLFEESDSYRSNIITNARLKQAEKKLYQCYVDLIHQPSGQAYVYELIALWPLL